jgi:hypothetical protein
MAKKSKAVSPYKPEKISGDKPINFGIKKEAVTKYNQLHEAMEEARTWPCKDNPYYYQDYDDTDFQDKGGKQIPTLLTEDYCEQLCSGCPLLKLCYDFAVANDEVHGVWGGINFTEKK